MSNIIIDAAVEGRNGYNGKVYFFHNDQYTRYNWSADRAEDGYPGDLQAWHLPAGFEKGIDAILNGKAKFEGKVYFFKGDQYVRYDWKSDKPDQGYPASLSAWNLPGGFNSGIDAAFNGVGKYEGKAYLFKGGEYVRYDWKNDKPDQGYPQPISAWGLPAHFLTGIDATVNGIGNDKSKVYFFKGNEYARYNWDTDKVEAVNKIADYWPLLAEMISIGNAKTKAFEWIWDALPKIKAYINTLQSGAAFPHNQTLMEQALATHFKIPVTMSVADKITNLQVIRDEYEKVETSLHNSGKSFRGRLLAEAITDKGVDKNGKPYPAYTWFQNSINFTSSFNGFGPLCQAAMVLHENVHYVDSAATAANDFYEHGTAYNTMTLSQALHNPSSYVSFAQHLFYGADERYGAGRPSL